MGSSLSPLFYIIISSYHLLLKMNPTVNYKRFSSLSMSLYDKIRIIKKLSQ